MLAICGCVAFTVRMSEARFDFEFDNAEIKYSPQFRDIILDFMPPVTLVANSLVVVEFMPNTEEYIELALEYDPEDDTLTVEAEETIKTSIRDSNDAEQYATLNKTCSLRLSDGGIVYYNEEFDGVYVHTDDDSVDTEAYEPALQHALYEVTEKLTQDKIDYFIDLFAAV